MGWVSMNEDIAEVLAQREHFRAGFDNIIARQREAIQASENTRVSLEINEVSQRAIEAVEKVKEKILNTLDDAERMLRKPNMNIVRKIEKGENRIEKLKGENDEMKFKIEKYRRKEKEYISKLNELRAANEAMKTRIQHLENNHLAWAEEVKNVKRQPRR